MADFISGFWDLYVMGIVAFGLVLCLILMVANMTSQESGAPQVQGHVWDENLMEYNNPLPRWWLILFVGTVLFAIVYLVIYPGFGTRNSTPEKETGLRKEYAEEMRQSKAAYSLEKYAGTQNLAALAGDKEAMVTGQRLFLTYCTQCHGSSGKGAYGYPNLTDDDWQYGGDPETIKATITEGRAGVMTAFGGTLNPEQITDVANYVLSLSGNKNADLARAERGKPIFEAPGSCSLCHGPDGKGALSMGPEMAGLGGPNLTDDIWLYDDKLETIIEGITNGRNNAMPTWKHFLDDAKLNVLAAYVYSLSKK